MPTQAGPLKVAVIGAGWAGLAAAVRATQAGHQWLKNLYVRA